MKFASAVVVAAAQTALGAAVAANGALSTTEIVETILQNPHLLTPSSYKTLDARARHALDSLEKRQTPQAPQAAKGGKGLGGFNAGGLLQLLSGQNKSNSTAPKSTVPEVQFEKPQGWPEAKRAKIRYGPYRMAPTSEKNLESQLLNVQGMTNTFKVGAKKPCDGECTILALSGDIEYFDGKSATNSAGAWFHHAVLLNSGPKVVDGNCGTAKVDNMFMSGNERSVNGYALPGAKIKSGYSIHKEDNFILTTELMNLRDEEQWVWLTINYEYLEGHQPEYKQGRMLWMTIGPLRLTCPGASNVSPWGATNLTAAQQPKTEVFSEHSFPWTAPRDGWILATGGHMHDGGVSLEIFQNKDRICQSIPKYGEAGGHSHGMGGMRRRQVKGGGKSNTEIAHIDKQGGCEFPEGKPLKKGDTMYLSANYDFKTHPGMKNTKGELDEIMGIVGSIVAF